jgi:hypothetical protein
MQEKEENQNKTSVQERQSLIEEFEAKPENLFNRFLEDINAQIQDKELEKQEKDLFLSYINKEEQE